MDQLKKVVTEQYPGRFDVDTGPNGGLIINENTALNRVGEKIKR